MSSNQSNVKQFRLFAPFISALLLFFCAFLPLLSGCEVRGFAKWFGFFGRGSRFYYELHIMPKEGKKLPPMVFYVPFPRHNDTLQQGLFNNARAISTSEENDLDIPRDRSSPNLKLSSVSTPQGRMLRIENTTDVPGIILRASDDYWNGPLPISRPDKKYPLEPVYGRHNPAKTYIYASLRNKKWTQRYYFLIKYSASYLDVYLPGAQNYGGGSKFWVVGKSITPINASIEGSFSTYQTDKTEITDRGWQSLPVWWLL